MKNAAPVGLFCLLAAVLVASPLAAQRKYYASNPSGQALGEPLNTEKIADLPYVLVVEVAPEGDIRRLYDQEGAELKRWERVFAETGLLVEEAIYHGGEIDSIRRYSPMGLPQEELLYRGGELEGRFVFSHRDRIPQGLSFSRPDGQEAYRDQYLYLPDGQFRGVKRIYEDGQVYTSLFTRLEGLPWEEWHSFQGMEILFRYDRRGRLVLQEERQEGELRGQVNFFYTADPPYRPTEEIRRDPRTGRETHLRYDRAGRPERETIFEEGLPLTLSLFSYQDDRLARRELRYRGGVDLWEYRYNEKGEALEERYSRNKELKKVIRYNPSLDYSRIEEFYRASEVFLRVFYRDNQPVHRELLGEGP